MPAADAAATAAERVLAAASSATPRRSPRGDEGTAVTPDAAAARCSSGGQRMGAMMAVLVLGLLAALSSELLAPSTLAPDLLTQATDKNELLAPSTLAPDLLTQATDKNGLRSTLVSGSWKAFSGKPLSALLRTSDESLRDATFAGKPLSALLRTRDESWSNATLALTRAATDSCQVAWVGLECPPGDLFTWSPPAAEWQLSIPANFDVALQPAPARTHLAQALFAQLRATGCASWRRGVLLDCTRPTTALPLPVELARHWPHARFMVPQVQPLPPDHPASGPGLPLCDARNLSQLSDGHVDDSTRLWTPRSCRLPYRFPLPELRTCLLKQRVLMVGDSVARQFLGRTIAAIRGQPLVSEHEFSSLVRYSFDGTHDEVRGFSSVFGPNSDSLVGRGEEGPMDVVSAELRLGVDLPAWQHHMIWLSDTKLLRWRNIRKIMRVFKPTHLVLGTSYWLQNDTESALAPDRIVRSLVSALATEASATAALRSVLWQEFPCHVRNAWDDKRVYERLHEPRNTAIVAKLQRTWARAGASSVLKRLRLGFLPNCAVARSGIGEFAVDTVHTACRWHPAPSVRGRSLPMSEVRAARNLDCSDPIGYTSARVLLSELGCGGGEAGLHGGVTGGAIDGSTAAAASPGSGALLGDATLHPGGAAAGAIAGSDAAPAGLVNSSR